MDKNIKGYSEQHLKLRPRKLEYPENVDVFLQFNLKGEFDI